MSFSLNTLGDFSLVSARRCAQDDGFVQADERDPQGCRLQEQQDKVPEVPSQASESLARQDVEAAAPRVPDHLARETRARLVGLDFSPKGITLAMRTAERRA
jgi:hypothetical protein